MNLLETGMARIRNARFAFHKAKSTILWFALGFCLIQLIVDFVVDRYWPRIHSSYLAAMEDRIGNLRREFLHQTSSRMVASCAVLATEELRTQNMSRSARGTQDKPGRMVRQKAGLNREILSAGLGMVHHMLAYKAVEAGTRLHVSNTRQLKPSQRCAACWEIVPKTLAQRVHECPHCGHTAPRDQNAASVVLIDAHMPGTGVAARPKPLARQRATSTSVTRETPATASQDA